jgi:hypothetical protein
MRVALLFALTLLGSWGESLTAVSSEIIQGEGDGESNTRNLAQAKAEASTPDTDVREVWEDSTMTKEQQITALLPRPYPSPVPLPFPLQHVTPNTLATYDSDIVLYVHMPKTAGQTFHRILSRRYM